MDPAHQSLARAYEKATTAAERDEIRRLGREIEQVDAPTPAGWSPRRAALHAGRHLGALPPRQAAALSHVLRKMFERDWSEVGMSRHELASISCLTADGARTALDGLTALGILERTTRPRMAANRAAQQRQYAVGRGFWFYSLPSEELPDHVAGPLLAPVR